MARTVQGATLGGDFSVTYVEAGELTTLLHLGIDAHPEQASIEAVVAQQRFPGRKAPEVGDKLRVVIGLEPQDDEYGQPREAKVGVPIALLRRVIDRLSDEHLLRELTFIVQSVDDFMLDVETER